MARLSNVTRKKRGMRFIQPDVTPLEVAREVARLRARRARREGRRSVLERIPPLSDDDAPASDISRGW